MRLVSPTSAELNSLSGWFASQYEVHSWAGPGVSYPLFEPRLRDELNINSLATYCMFNEEDAFVGFGQFYNRLGRCHFGRLAISPSHRGQEHIQTLIVLLGEQGQQTLGLNSQSLFVLGDNSAAIRAYQKLGFKETPYPEHNPLEDCHYMIRD